MKKKFLLPILLLATLSIGGGALVGCTGPKNSSSVSSVYSVAIANKEALQAEWFSGTSRDLDLNLTPEANVLQELNEGNLTVTSSDEEVVKVSGVSLAALKGGNATITVDYRGSQDTVELTILQNSPKVKYGAAHEGNAEDPFTNEDALLVAASPKYEGEDYYVSGKIASWYHAPGERTNDGVVSYFLEPATAGGKQFEVYKCLKEDGTALTDDDIWKGGVAVAHGAFTEYQGQYETTSAKFVSCTGNKPAARTTNNVTVAQAIAAGKELPDGDSAWDYYNVTGYLVKQSGNNYFMSDEKDPADSDKDMFEIYGATAEGLADKLKREAKITIKATVKNYHNQIETCLPVANDDVTVVEAGKDSWEIDYQEKTVAEAITLANALDNGATADAHFQIQGFVVAVSEAFNETTKKISFTIGDTADEANPLKVINAKTDADTAKKVVAGASVLVKGRLQKAVKNDETTEPVLVKGEVEIGSSIVYTSVGSLSFNKDTTVTIDNKLSEAEDPKITYTSTSGVSIVVRKNTSSNNVNVWNNTYTSCRWYVGHKVTFSHANDFNRIVLTCDASYDAFKDEADGTTITALKEAGVKVKYMSGRKIVLDLPAPVKTFDLVSDKQIRPSNVELLYGVDNTETIVNEWNAAAVKAGLSNASAKEVTGHFVADGAETFTAYKIADTGDKLTLSYEAAAAKKVALKLYMTTKNSNVASCGIWYQGDGQKTKITLNGTELTAPAKADDKNLQGWGAGTASPDAKDSGSSLSNPVWVTMIEFDLAAGANTIVLEYLGGGYSYWIAGAKLVEA